MSSDVFGTSQETEIEDTDGLVELSRKQDRSGVESP